MNNNIIMDGNYKYFLFYFFFKKKKRILLKLFLSITNYIKVFFFILCIFYLTND